MPGEKLTAELHSRAGGEGYFGRMALTEERNQPGVSGRVSSGVENNTAESDTDREGFALSYGSQAILRHSGEW